MALEIERRFLVVGEGWRSHVRWQAQLQQGYLTSTPGALTVRVRLSHDAGAEFSKPVDQGWLTLKAPAAGPEGRVRQEFEYPIPVADAAALLALAPHRLSKHRHGLALVGGDWVVDVFEGPNAPLVVAEVELTSPEQPLTVPSWCGLELTGRHELSNAALAHRPLASWPVERREPLLQALGSDLQIS